MRNAHSKPSINALIVQRLHLNHVRFWFKAKTGAVDSLQPRHPSVPPKIFRRKVFIQIHKICLISGKFIRTQYSDTLFNHKTSEWLPCFYPFLNTWYIFFVCGSTVNLKHKSNKISRYFHGLFFTLVIFALHELVNEH